MKSKVPLYKRNDLDRVCLTFSFSENTDNLHLAAGEYTNVLKEQIQLIEQVIQIKE